MIEGSRDFKSRRERFFGLQSQPISLAVISLLESHGRGAQKVPKTCVFRDDKTKISLNVETSFATDNLWKNNGVGQVTSAVGSGGI